MTSLSIMEFRSTLEKYITEYDLPSEVKRMVLKDIYESVAQNAKDEAIAELKEREGKTE